MDERQVDIVKAAPASLIKMFDYCIQWPYIFLHSVGTFQP